MDPKTFRRTSRPRRMVGTSLKLYFDLVKTQEYVKGVAELSEYARSLLVDLFVIPDFVSLTKAQELLKDTTVKLGAQDTFWEDNGAYTGEVSPLVLKQVGVRIVEIGHAERRYQFGETNEQVAKKAAAVVRHGMIPLVCVGERNHSQIASAAVGMAIEECKPQINSVLEATPQDAELIIAYEPVWAIGAKEPADADHVVAVTQELRKLLKGRKSRILYGGSAGPGTFAKLAPGVDGLFLGRFAHDLKNLKQVITELSEVE